MATAKKLYKSSIARTYFTIVRMIVAFFMMPFIINKLGDRWYGIWIILGSLTGYYYLLDFGLASALTRFVAHSIAKNDSKNTNVIINTSIAIYSFLALVVLLSTVVLVLLLGYFVENTTELEIIRLVLIIIGVQLSLEFPFKAFAGIVQAYIRYDLLTYAHLFTLALSTGAIFWFLAKGFGILTFALIGFSSSLISNILFLFISKYLFFDLQISYEYFKKEKMRELFGYSIWAFLTQIANQLRFKIDSIILVYLLSASHVTHYFIGARLAEYFINLLSKATNIVTPVFTSYYAKNDFDEIRNKLLFFNKINVILGFFGGGLIIILGKIFIHRWMGENYLDAYPVLIILTSAMVIDFVHYPSASVLYAISKHQYLSIINIIEAILNLILSVILTMKYGIFGCALGTAIPLIFTRVFMIPVYTTKSINLSTTKYYLDMLPSIVFTICYLVLYYTIVTNIIVIPLYTNIIFAVVLSLPLYFISIFFISFNNSEKSMILSLLPFSLITSVRH